uniref:Lens fiber membrane intrinsic protein n=2 Tax=Anolis carolinensis TaxID=28377 RepID=H9GGC1_ANOCA|nr:PREDICTED: lens fiber membrane intrinsic protein isoform X1 [Anolis carolinensis]|eukprot:XP_008115508.1 PREDICTED: lens fiber membrane intrinsic protein isoform X1 [Anolis carolinensis]
MADKQASHFSSPEKRPVLLSSSSSSTELATSASSDLQPFSLGRASTSSVSPSNLSSYTVPVRLDVLYFLLNSAAKGAQSAQNALPSVPTQAGQGPFSTYPYPATQHVVSSCSCCHHSQCGTMPSYATVPHPVAGANCLGATQGSFVNQAVLSAGVLGNQNSGQRYVVTRQGDGKGGPGFAQPQPGNVWRSRESTTGWMENQRQEGADRGNSWQGKWPSRGRSWGDRRQGSSEPGSWNTGSKGWGREGSPFGSNSGGGRRNQEWGSRKMPWDAPEAKRRQDDVKVEWPRNHSKPEATSSASKAADTNPAKPSLIQAGEDWDLDYKSKKASSAPQASVSHPAPQKNQGDAHKASEEWDSEYSPSPNPPKSKPSTSLLFGSCSKDPKSSTAKIADSRADQSKNGGFASYLKGLSSDLPGKSSSEGSTDLIIETDMELSKDSDEEQSSKSVAGEESKASKIGIKAGMYSFMGGGLLCASVGNVLLVVSTVTDYWMQYRVAGTFAHQGLWRYCFPGKCYMQMEKFVLFPSVYWNSIRAFMILSALTCFAGVITGILSFAQLSTSQRFNRSFVAGILFFVSALFVILAMGLYTGVTVNFLGKRFGDWRFSWSYILGWVSLLLTFFAGIFYMCAYKIHKCQRLAGVC